MPGEGPRRKLVASSLVALAVGLAPWSAHAAKPSPKSDAARVERPAKKTRPSADKPKKSERAGNEDDSAGKADKKTAPHAGEVDLSGDDHGEPKPARGEILVPASVKSAAESVEAEREPYDDLPTLPSPDPAPSTPPPSDEEAGRKRDAEPIERVTRREGIRRAEDEAGRRAEGKAGKRAEDQAGKRAEGKAGKRVEDKAGKRVEDQAGKDKAGKRAEDQAGKRAEGKTGKKKGAPLPSKPACLKDPVEIVRGPEVERFALLTCDGAVAPLAIERLSILVRPGAAARPTAPVAELAKKPGAQLAPGIRRVDPRLLPRLQAIAERFAKPTSPTRMFIISGYRPTSVGSMHSTGRAIDFRVEGATNEDVVTFCKTLEDTGCGYYPNSSFVHIDVRDPGAGHVSWIDVSGPGEPPRYVSEWPLPAAPPPSPDASEHVVRASATEPSSALVEEGERLLRATRPLEREAGEEDPHADLAP